MRMRRKRKGGGEGTTHGVIAVEQRGACERLKK